MLRRQLAYGLVFVSGLACACSSTTDEDSPQGDGSGGSGGSSGGAIDSGTPDAPAADAEPEVEAGPVYFADGNLEQCVRTALQMPDGEIHPEALEPLTHLECQDMGITSVEGLEHATSLVDLSLWENAIVDVGPLAKLTRLEYLQLGANQISDLSALTSLGSLRRLGASVNQISSLQPLASLTTLEWLNLDRNAFGEQELVHLAGLTNLTWLTVEHNGIQDHSALQPVLEAGCDLYDHNSASTAAAPHAARVTIPTVTADPSRLHMRVDETGRVRMSYDFGSSPLQARVVSGSLVRSHDRIVALRGQDRIEVGRMRGGLPVVCQQEHAHVCRLHVGMKWPEAGATLPGTGDHPVVTVSVELITPPRSEVRSEASWAAADEDILPLVLASPNQFDAGSCLFMANTGAMEILLNQHTPEDQIDYLGDTDLSERFLMAAFDHVPMTTTPYFLTDLLYTFEGVGGALLNRDYPFCAGYVVETSSGSVAPAKADDEGAYLSCSYNWFDKMPEDWQSMLVPTPPAERTSIFVDPKRDDNSQWRVALFDDDTIERIKHELRTKNAPVIVIYNHYLYWHANIIVGYDDDVAASGCPMVEDSIDYFEEKGFASYANTIRNHMDEHGGCSDSGVFYVRDSIYEGGADEPYYDYSTDEVSIEKERYSKRIVKLDYDWAKYLGNHTYTVHRK